MQILKYPHPALAQVAKEIVTVDDPVREMAEQMFITMAEKRGLGLAGNQVGYLHRLIVVNPVPGTPEHERAYVNPEIVQSEGEATGEEGCLSIPGVNGKVTRAAKVRMTALDLQGLPVTVEAEGVLARVLQHEIDHINGVLITSYFSAFDRAANARTLRELEKAAKATLRPAGRR